MASDVVSKVTIRAIAPYYLKEEVVHEIQEAREVCQPWKKSLESLKLNLPDKTSAWKDVRYPMVLLHTNVVLCDANIT